MRFLRAAAQGTGLGLAVILASLVLAAVSHPLALVGVPAGLWVAASFGTHCYRRYPART